MLRVALMALLGLAVLAPVGHASESLQESVTGASRQAQRLARKASTRLEVEAEATARRQGREAEHAAIREANRNAREATRLAQQEKDGNRVSFSCSAVTIDYSGFNAVPASPNTTVETVTIKNLPASVGSAPPLERNVSFEGSSTTSVIPIAFPVGQHYLVDVHAQWNTNGHKGNFDIHGQLSCPPAPAFTIEKLQSIAGSGPQFTTTTLAGTVGQTVDYKVIATNTGNTPLTFSQITDKNCESITNEGSVGVPVEPTATVTFRCTHTLTSADEAAGSYRNVAKITGTPEAEEGAPISHESNPVEVTPISPKKTQTGGETKTTSETGVLGTGTTSTTSNTNTPNGPTASGGTGGSAPKIGVLAFASATVPALHGPQGCVRGNFTVSIKSAGVASVTFYLDGHRLRQLSAKAARKGLLSISISSSKLKVGVHKVMAKITMKATAPSAKAAKASRALMVVRCESAVLTPRFTG